MTLDQNGSGPDDHHHVDEPTEALQRPLLTVKEAAQAAGVHPNTIRRRLSDGAFPGATRREGDGAHLVPVGDLVAAGFHLHRSTPPEGLEPIISSPDLLADLRRDLAAERARADQAEALLRERDRLVAEAQARAQTAETALKMLTAAPAPALERPATPPPQRRWWRR